MVKSDKDGGRFRQICKHVRGTGYWVLRPVRFRWGKTRERSVCDARRRLAANTDLSMVGMVELVCELFEPQYSVPVLFFDFSFIMH